jgi:hypothetical protein
MVINNDSKASNQHSAYNGLIIRKFVKDDWKDFNNYGLVADNCYPYLRYAEVLMTYIEAKNEMGQCTQEDLDKTINLLRERAYRGTGIAYPRVEVASQADLRKIIRMDRRQEFAFEGCAIVTCYVGVSLRNRITNRWTTCPVPGPVLPVGMV